MVLEPLATTKLYSQLRQIDDELAEQVRQRGCPYCGGPLHHADYLRKARGGPDALPDRCLIRCSLCCGREGCRRRCLPPSCLFFGRKVYFGCVILLVLTARTTDPRRHSARALRRRFGVSWETVKRWARYFQQEFPRSRVWQRIRGRLPAAVCEASLPQRLVQYCFRHSGNEQDGVVATLRLLASGQGPLVHAH